MSAFRIRQRPGEIGRVHHTLSPKFGTLDALEPPFCTAVAPSAQGSSGAQNRVVLLRGTRMPMSLLHWLCSRRADGS